MKPARPPDRRIIIAVFLLLIMVAETSAYLLTTPRQREEFFQFYVLGANRLVADYYPQNDANVRLTALISWYLGVINSMGNTQLVEIRVKLGNETTTPPNDTDHTPSSGPELTSFDQFLSDNETWEFPFTWSILNATTTAGLTNIVTLELNSQLYQVSNWSAANGNDFCLIFELWVWQNNAGSFEFGWNDNGVRQTAWLQLWFNLTSTNP